MHTLSVAELVIYVLLALPVVYVLVKHGKQGLLGWIYLFAFCALRIIGAGLDISGSKSASIISNIGLSPLILASNGVLHEA